MKAPRDNVPAYRSAAEAFRVRTEAARCAATVLAGRKDDTVTPMAWCLAVFFESYIAKGSEYTHRDFGPKKPVKLRVVRKPAA